MKKDKIITLMILILIISFLNKTDQTAYAESEDKEVNQAQKQKNRATEIKIINLLNKNEQTNYEKSEDKEIKQAQKQKNRATEVEMLDSKLKIKRFVYDSGLDFTYPDAVRGIYVTGNSAGGEKLDELLKLV